MTHDRNDKDIVINDHFVLYSAEQHHNGNLHCMLTFVSSSVHFPCLWSGDKAKVET